MKIAIVVTGGLHPSGREQVVPSLLALFSELAKQHDLHAFALRHLPTPQSYQLDGFAVHDLGRPSAPIGLTPWAQARALRSAMAQHGPFDIVHGFWADPAGALAVRMARDFGVPSIATFDSGEFESIPEIDYGSQRTMRGRRAVREALSATRVHVCTNFMARKVAAQGTTPVIIPLTSVVADAHAPSRRAMREASLRIVQVASLSRVKNQRLLIDAVAMLAASIKMHLDLVGEDTLDGELQRHAAASAIANRVTFHGFVPHEGLRPILANADLYVQSSLHEAAGVSVLEAAAHGVPVLGTRVGYLADWTPDRALTIDAPDAAKLAAAIDALHHDRGETMARAARARAWALQHDARHAAQQFDKLYKATATRGR
jgi:glycosyltransferase involved in cell wall biosynthesis